MAAHLPAAGLVLEPSMHRGGWVDGVALERITESENGLNWKASIRIIESNS